jgi:hypothetical protein
VDRIHTEFFTVHCTQPSFHQFSFENEISILTLHVIDSNSANNTMTTNYTPGFTTTAAVAIISQTILADDCVSPAPALMTVSIDKDICLKKVVRNNGPYGPADISVDKTAEFVPGGGQVITDATVSPTAASDTVPNVPVATNATHNEIFTLHCYEAGSFEFLFTNTIGVEDLHVSSAGDYDDISFIVTCEDGVDDGVGGTVEFLQAPAGFSGSEQAASASTGNGMPLALALATAGAALLIAAAVYARRRWLR